MYIEHPYKYDGKYYANVDGKMIEITKEVAYAMNNFYRSSQPRKVEIKNEKGEEYLYALLEQIDPDSAKNIHPNNVVRVMR